MDYQSLREKVVVFSLAFYTHRKIIRICIWFRTAAKFGSLEAVIPSSILVCDKAMRCLLADVPIPQPPSRFGRPRYENSVTWISVKRYQCQASHTRLNGFYLRALTFLLPYCVIQ